LPVMGVDIAALTNISPPGMVSLTLQSSELPRYLAAADIGFLLRETDPVNAVASPVKFAEYLAAGLGVVTSPGLEGAAELVVSRRLGLAISPTPDADEIGQLADFVDNFNDQKERISEEAVVQALNNYDWGSHLNRWRTDVLDEIKSDEESEFENPAGVM